MKKFLNGFLYALRGIRWALATQVHMRIHVFIFALVLAAGAILGISPVEWALVMAVSALVMTAELLNSAVEEICNHLWPHKDQRAAVVKDVAAGAVLMAAAGAAAVGLCVFGPPLLRLAGL